MWSLERNEVVGLPIEYPLTFRYFTIWHLIVAVNRSFAHIAFPMMMVWTPVAAQPAGGGDLFVLKTRWDSIAESVLVMVPKVSAKINLMVETETDQSVIENSFLAGFERRGMAVMIGKEASSEKAPVLRISVIVSLMAPTVRASCDARWEDANGTVRFLGRFHAENALSPSDDGGLGRTTMERIFEPLVVIAGAVMIMYLFFTVRS